jgi:hypothetical protein
MNLLTDLNLMVCVLRRTESLEHNWAKMGQVVHLPSDLSDMELQGCKHARTAYSRFANRCQWDVEEVACDRSTQLKVPHLSAHPGL